MRLACVNRRSPSFTAQLGLMAMAFYANATMPADVFAWENNCSHPRITQNAVSLLNTSGNGVPASPFFSEFVLYDPSIESGVQAEDTPNLAVVNHFYDAKTLSPLHTSDPADNQTLQNISIGGSYWDAFGSPKIPLTTAMGSGSRWFDQAVDDCAVHFRSRHLAPEFC